MNRQPLVDSILILLCCMSASPKAADLLTGNRFDAQMRLPASVYWSKVPLRDAVESLSRTRKVAIWLDRRCDPSQLVSFQASSASLEECFWKLSEQENELETAWIDGVVLIGPASCPNRLATVHALHQRQLDKLPIAERRRWRNAKPMAWPRLATPRTLLQQLEQEVGRPIHGQDRVFHDLWPAKQLPALPVFSRLGLLLAGFDLTFVLNQDGSARIIQMPKNPRIAKTIPRNRLKIVRQVIADHPEAQLSGSRQLPTLTASWRTHQLVKQKLRSNNLPKSAALVRYSLRADNQPIGPFVRGLCKQLELNLEITEVAEPHLDTQISFKVEQVDRATLFSKIMGQANLRYELNEQTRTLRILGLSNSDEPGQQPTRSFR